MFRILDRYLVREILPPFGIALIFFSFTLELQPLRIAERLIERGAAWTRVGEVIGGLLPQALAVTIPMAFLVGLLIAFGRISADREYVALQACGVGLGRLLK